MALNVPDAPPGTTSRDFRRFWRTATCDLTRHAISVEASHPMASKPTAAGVSAIAIATAKRLSPASRSSVLSSFVVVGLLLALVLLPLIAAGCGPPT